MHVEPAAAAAAPRLPASERPMHEIRLVGRGGQGVVTAGELLGKAAVDEGRQAQSLPTFGPERRGALCTATLRLAAEPIRLKCTTAHPDLVLVLDPTVWHHANVLLGLTEGATLVFNSAQPPAAIRADLEGGRYGYRPGVRDYRVVTVDATSIALAALGRAIPNTAMIGAFAAATGWVGMEAIEAALRARFGDRAGANIEAARAAAAAVVVEGG